MTSGELLGDIIKVGMVSLIWNKSLQVVGKKNFGEIIGASGIVVCGIDLLQILKLWQDNPPVIIQFFKTIFNVIKKVDENTGKLSDSIKSFIEKGTVIK